MTPRKSATVHCEILHDEICLYDWDRKEVHALNRTAARIWQLCDGHSTAQEIANRLGSELAVPDAEALVWLALADFREKGLIDADLPMPGDRTLSRRQVMARLGLTAVALPVIHSIVAPTALQAASAGSQTFDFTGAAQSFLVAAGVRSITIDAYGADGGAYFEPDVFRPGGGGKGGRVQATFAVTPGELLVVTAGGSGKWGDANSAHVGGAPGFNGGGRGGVFGGGGGGASDVRRGATTLVVAGGGGGAAGSFGGGAGGGLVGAAGATLSTNPKSGQPGGGGTQSAGGAGGLGSRGINYIGEFDTSGGAGAAGVGGDGGYGSLTTNPGGGAGGGGFFGGGGGGGGDLVSATGGSGPGGGGGGGSSYTDPSATNVTHTQGFRAGQGQIIISW